MATTTIGTTTVHVIGKCPIKGCKNRSRITVTDAPVRRTNQYTYTDWQIPAAAPYGQVQAHLSQRSDRHHGYGLNPRPSQWLANHPRDPYERVWFDAVTAAGWVCTEHDRFMVTVEVAGVVREDRACDGRCLAATGPNCECSCGGANHGAMWSIG